MCDGNHSQRPDYKGYIFCKKFEKKIYFNYCLFLQSVLKFSLKMTKGSPVNG